MRVQTTLMGQKLLHFVSLSFGKDSLAMFIKLILLGIIKPHNTVVGFANPGFEYKIMLKYIGWIKKIIGDKFPEWKGFEILIVHPKDTWEHWFYGKAVSGKHKGKPRGMPLRNGPCWWSREAKVNPLARAQRGYENVYVGIALDEPSRHKNAEKVEGFTRSGQIVYPLVDWGMTEDDCVKFLEEQKIPRCPLYDHFDRIGCMHCQKMSEMSLYHNWKYYPEAWKLCLHWEAENYGVHENDMEFPFCLLFTWVKKAYRFRLAEDLEPKFKAGYVPKRQPKYACDEGCTAVRDSYATLGCGVLLEVEHADREEEESHNLPEKVNGGENGNMR